MQVHIVKIGVWIEKLQHVPHWGHCEAGIKRPVKPFTYPSVYPKRGKIEASFEEGTFLSKPVIKIEGFWEDLYRNSIKLDNFPQNQYILVVFSYIWRTLVSLFSLVKKLSEKPGKFSNNKGSFTYYVITKGEGGGFRNDNDNVILLYPVPNLITEGGGGLETDKNWLRNMCEAPKQDLN